MALRHLPIAAPCSASFAVMPGDDAKRFCDACEKHVHDLSAGTEAEARRVLASAKGDRMCVRYAAKPDGTIRFRAAAAAIALSLAACSGADAASDPVAPNAVNEATPPPPEPTAEDADAGTEVYLMGDIDPSVAE